MQADARLVDGLAPSATPSREPLDQGVGEAGEPEREECRRNRDDPDLRREHAADEDEQFAEEQRQRRLARPLESIVPVAIRIPGCPPSPAVIAAHLRDALASFAHARAGAEALGTG